MGFEECNRKIVSIIMISIFLCFAATQQIESAPLNLYDTKNSLDFYTPPSRADSEFAGTLENGVQTEGYLSNENGEYWTIDIPEGTKWGIAQFECGDNDLIINAFEDYSSGIHGSGGGETTLLLTLQHYSIDSYSFQILQGLGGFGPYNITVTFYSE